MNYHYRSHSEQPQQAVPPVGHQPTVESYITIHSDSQQSLDRLFNPSTPAVPLRGRNLPRSFFEPGHKIDENGTTNGNGIGSNPQSNLHHRSISYGFSGTINGQQQPAPPVAPRRNFHMRTHSTALAPMSTLPASNHSSYQSSQEVLNTDSSISTNNWLDNGSQLTSSMESTEIVNNGQSGGIIDAAPANVLHNQQQQPPPPMQNHHTPPTQTLMQPNQQNFFDRQIAPQVLAPTQDGNFTSPNVPANAVGSSSLHARSMSYDQRQIHARPVISHHNLHSRTHSTLAPMSGSGAGGGGGGLPLANQIQNNSSQEFLNYHHHHPYNNNLNNNNNNNQSATGWSSSGYSSDDMTSAVNNWAAGQPMVSQQQQHAHATIPSQQMISQPPSIPPQITQVHQPTNIATSMARPSAAQSNVFYQI